MKTVTENAIVHPADFGNLEGLIQKLNEIRASTNEKIQVCMNGSDSFGYRLQLSWERPMTEAELQRYEQNLQKAKEAAKEMRRQEYEKLKAEFETE